MSAAGTVYLETFGCQMNVLDSELVLGELLSEGWRPTDDATAADLVILNTCSVRQHAEDKVRSRLGQLRSRHVARRERIIAVIGCMAERDGDGLLARMPQVDILAGPSELHRVPALVADVLATRRRAIALSGRLRDWSTGPQTVAAHTDLESLDSARHHGLAAASAGGPGRFQAYVRITRGCNKWCTFCVVPMTRGPEVHRPAEQIIAEVGRLADAGVVEVTLLGQTINHYAHDDGSRTTTFADLLRRVHDRVPHLPRLRFVTSYPRDFSDDALRAMADCPRICRYLHIPAQSGSDRILRGMNRGYTVAQYRGLLDRARQIMPDVSISGDIIVGFPGETDEDFAATVELVRTAGYKNCFIFKYSPRPGTRADEKLIDDVPEEVKRGRNNELLAVQSAISLAANRGLMDRTVEVLVEGFSKAARRLQETGNESPDERAVPAAVEPRGSSTPLPRRHARQLVGRTPGDQIVVFDGPASLVGRIVPVRVAAVTPFTLHGVVEVVAMDDVHGGPAAEEWRAAASSAERGQGLALPVIGAAGGGCE
ncbi:MAG: tRNA (N6-isopentenyl adenosine(37)-C2)-methylthiotransferase MiaB [Phycisphaerae bacterium]